MFILSFVREAAFFERLRSTAENCFAFFRRRWRSRKHHPMCRVRGKKPTQGEQDETAFENIRRARNRVIRVGLSCDGDAGGGGPKRVLPPGRHFRNALLQL
jgi:hypothetical protein